VLALVVGLFTAALAAGNRARGHELDRLERWCEAQARRNELVRLANLRREWRLLGSRRAQLPDAEELRP
jgi:hypothetical protein